MKIQTLEKIEIGQAKIMLAFKGPMNAKLRPTPHLAWSGHIYEKIKYLNIPQ